MVRFPPQGLSCLKRAGVAHRDMSPENLMVHDDNVYIIDMGMCLRIPSSLHDDDYDYDYHDDCDYYDGTGNPMERYRRHRVDDRRRGDPSYSRIPPAASGTASPRRYASARGPFDGPAADLWAGGRHTLRHAHRIAAVGGAQARGR